VKKEETQTNEKEEWDRKIRETITKSNQKRNQISSLTIKPKLNDRATT